MLSIFSCACWSSVYLPWKNVYLGLLPIWDCELGIDGCKLLFLEWINNEILLCSTENYI